MHRPSHKPRILLPVLNILFGVVLTTALMTITPANAAPKVVASIQPIHSLVAAVMDGVGEPDLLISGNSSPHSYSLKPSQAGQLSRAELVFWVSPQVETFLVKTLENSSSKIVRLADAPNIAQQPLRDLIKLSAGKADDHGDEHHDDEHDGHKDEHKDEHKDAHEHAHEEGANDPHIWLDPKNGVVMVNTIVTELTAVDPDNGAAYRANGAAKITELTALDEAIAASFKGKNVKPYIVFHDAYAHFESRYGLQPAGVVTLNPELTPGARSIVRLRQEIVERSVNCIYLEPQFSPRSVSALVDGTNIAQSVLDPLGATLKPGKELYAQLLKNMSDAFLTCGVSG